MYLCSLTSHCKSLSAKAANDEMAHFIEEIAAEVVRVIMKQRVQSVEKCVAYFHCSVVYLQLFFPLFLSDDCRRLHLQLFC